ncbi:putative D5 family helicase-transposase [Faustovirus]|nr:putative D5 family helicase-transposase [Faustovirus]
MADNYPADDDYVGLVIMLSEQCVKYTRDNGRNDDAFERIYSSIRLYLLELSIGDGIVFNDVVAKRLLQTANVVDTLHYKIELQVVAYEVLKNRYYINRDAGKLVQEKLMRDIIDLTVELSDNNVGYSLLNKFDLKYEILNNIMSKYHDLGKRVAALDNIRNVNRTAMSEKKRQRLWIKHYGMVKKSVCLCCDESVIYIWNFVIGHVISISSGGDNSMANLRPICGTCNTNMGTANLKHYMQNLAKKRELMDHRYRWLN